MRKNLLTCFFCLVTAASCYSQFSIGLLGGAALPLGKLRNEGSTAFIKGIDFQYLPTKRFAIGISLSHASFGAKENTSDWYYSRIKTQLAPLLVTTKYYFLTGKIKPFVGIGLGAYYCHFYLENRYFSTTFPDNFYFEENKFRFGLAPEVGIAFEVLPQLNIGLNKQLHCIFGYKYGNSSTRLFSALNLFVSYRLGK